MVTTNTHTHTTAQPHWWNDNKLFYHSYSFQFNRVTVVFSFVADITVHVYIQNTNCIDVIFFVRLLFELLGASEWNYYHYYHFRDVVLKRMFLVFLVHRVTQLLRQIFKSI